MSRALRFAGTWALRTLLFVILLVLLDVAVLAFPSPLFPHRERFGEFAVWSSKPIPGGFRQTMEEARARIAAMEHARPGAGQRIFICGNERLYSIFAFLTRKSPNTIAIGLSLLRTVYVNEPKIAGMAARNTYGIRHSRFEGNVAEVIAHEVAHFAAVGRLGLRAALALPAWKSEGYAEYQANLAATRADSSYALAERVTHLLNDERWRGSPSARQLFEWHLLVEFLAEEQGMDLDALADENVTEASARNAMLAWYRQRESPG